MIYDRRLVPGETIDDAVKVIQDIIDHLASEDPEFRAEVEVNSNVRSSYTGKSAIIKSQKDAWKIDANHPFIKACAEGLDAVGTNVDYGYWPFSTDIPAVSSIRKKPVVGFSGAQEFSIHTCFEKTRTDYLAQSIACNTSIFLKASQLPMSCFNVE